MQRIVSKEYPKLNFDKALYLMHQKNEFVSMRNKNKFNVMDKLLEYLD